MPSPFAAFVRLSRLRFLAGGLVGGGFGTAIAAYDRGSVDWGAYALAQLTISALHLMTHYANEYFDRDADRLTVRTEYSGGSGALVAGDLRPVVALRAALVCAAGGFVGALVLVTIAGRLGAALCAATIALLAWTYSAPPLRLLARGLGEATTAIVVAVLVPLCAYLAQGESANAAMLASTLPGAAAMLAMMLAVEYPDVEADRAGGKRNLVVRLGRARARAAGIALAIAAYAGAGLAYAAGAPPALAIMDAVSLPLGFSLARAFAARRDPADYAADEGLAARGVAFFFIVTLFGLFAYIATTQFTNDETTGYPVAVVGS